MHESHISRFFEWAVPPIRDASPQSDIFLLTGVYGALCEIYRVAPREILIQKTSLLNQIVVQNEKWVYI